MASSVSRRLLRTAAVLLILASLACLTGCRNKRIQARCPDGTAVSVRCRSARILERAPVFETDGDEIRMSFGGTVWYRACIIGGDYLEQIAQGPLAAESSNMLVFESSGHARCRYSYVLILDGTEEAFILFSTDTPPDRPDYGTDFTACIRYFAGGTETVPDLDWTVIRGGDGR